MGTMDNLVHATEIHTDGLMQGSWNRIASEESSKQIFQSKTHPDFTLKFTKAWLVEVKNDTEKLSYTYFWDPVQGYLTATDATQEDHKLAVKLVEVELQKNQNESLSDTILKNENLQAKIDDLQKQVYSLQYICSGQQQTLTTWTKRLEKEKEKWEKEMWEKQDNNAIDLHHSMSNNLGRGRLRPPKPAHLLSPFDPTNSMRHGSPSLPCDPTIQQTVDPNPAFLSGASGSLHVGQPMPCSCQNIPLPTFNQVMYQYPVHDHHYGNPLLARPHPVFPLAPQAQIPDPRSELPMARSNYRVPAHWQPPSVAPKAHEIVSSRARNNSHGSYSACQKNINTEVDLKPVDHNSNEESKMEQPPNTEYFEENKLNYVAHLLTDAEKGKLHETV